MRPHNPLELCVCEVTEVCAHKIQETLLLLLRGYVVNFVRATFLWVNVANAASVNEFLSAYMHCIDWLRILFKKSYVESGRESAVKKSQES